MGRERPRVENTWMGQVWPRVGTKNAGITLSPHLVPPPWPQEEEHEDPSHLAGNKAQQLQLALRKMKVGKSLGDGKPSSHVGVEHSYSSWHVLQLRFQ